MRAVVQIALGRRAEDSFSGWRLRLKGMLQAWQRRARARRALAQIDARTLRDAGIDPVAAQYELQKPFWLAERRLRDR